MDAGMKKPRLAKAKEKIRKVSGRTARGLPAQYAEILRLREEIARLVDYKTKAGRPDRS
jgi:hypothetical protein